MKGKKQCVAWLGELVMCVVAVYSFADGEASTITAETPPAEVAETARDYRLTLKPQRCISLHKGQQCTQKITAQWHTTASGRYCLYLNAEREALRCWPAADEPLAVDGGKEQAFIYRFKGTQSISFVVKDEASGVVVASRLFEVAWVYQSNRSNNSAWRLF